MTDDVLVFLHAQWDVDERIARASAADTDGQWQVQDKVIKCDATCMTIYDEGGHDEHDAAHIGRHDPRDTLARIVAERALVEPHRRLTEADIPHGHMTYGPLRECVVSGCGDWPCRTVLTLASGYRHRGGFRGEWWLPVETRRPVTIPCECDDPHCDARVDLTDGW